MRSFVASRKKESARARCSRSFTVVSWNVEGLNHTMLEEIGNSLQTTVDFDVLGFQETEYVKDELHGDKVFDKLGEEADKHDEVVNEFLDEMRVY